MTEGVIKSTNVKSMSLPVLRIGTHPIVYSIVLIFLIGTAAFFFGIVPFVHALQPGGSASVADARNNNDAAKFRLDSQKKIIDKIASLSGEDRKLLAFSLPIEADAPGLSIQLNAIAVNSGVKLSSLDIASGAETESLNSEFPQSVVPLNITISVDNASYDKIKILLANIENSLRVMDVRSISFSSGASTVSMELRTYYLKGI